MLYFHRTLLFTAATIAARALFMAETAETILDSTFNFFRDKKKEFGRPDVHTVMLFLVR